MRQNHQYRDKRADGGTTIWVEEQPHESPTQAILRGISALKGIDETDLDPLYNHIEADSMERLIEHSRDYDSKVSIKFSFEGCVVRVDGEGDIGITRDNTDHVG
ncbi:HalOD1 output domain-containing protein [Halomontanus rarus]|uniref:HalOD1 output domain-containing protein n=1 Tax=Halomontanus rarus TaxID=3034020 RepID=UPI00293BE637|nr:HalOD1 output domain-containing protein [Halovivax sp. KZCA124]